MSDAELERGCRDDRAKLPCLQASLRVVPPAAGEAAVVSQHGRFSQALGQMMCHPFAQTSRVDEHQRGAMCDDQRRKPIVDLAPHLFRRHGAELVLRYFDRQVQSAAVAVVDDLHVVLGAIGRAHQKPGDLFNRVHRRRQPDALQSWAAGFRHEVVETRQRERQVRAALVIDNRVNLIDDDRASRAEHASPTLGGQEKESDSGVVTRMCGGCRSISSRSTHSYRQFERPF